MEERGLYKDSFVSYQALKKILNMLMYLAQYSVTSSDVRAMLAIFRSDRLKEEEPEENALALYISAMEMMARTSSGPACYFDMSGVNSGFLVPSLVSFPYAGYTFSAWIRIEATPGPNAPLFTCW